MLLHLHPSDRPCWCIDLGCAFDPLNVLEESLFIILFIFEVVCWAWLNKDLIIYFADVPDDERHDGQPRDVLALRRRLLRHHRLRPPLHPGDQGKVASGNRMMANRCFELSDYLFFPGLKKLRGLFGLDVIGNYFKCSLKRVA